MDKKRELFLNQKETLDTFLERGAITQAQYDKSYGDLVKKMGMEEVAGGTVPSPVSPIETADQKNYIKWIRSRVGHEKIILTFAGGCIFNEKGQVLLQRRGDSNKWGFPGGAIELGETPQQAAVREVKEETGLDVEVTRLIGVYSDTDMVYPNGDRAQSIVIAYEFKVVGGELSCDRNETLELKFFSRENRPELFTGSHVELWNDILG